MSETKKNMQCPVCGYYTLDADYGDFCICPVCFWEDDSVQSKIPIMPGGANGPTLIGGRINYRENGCSEKICAKSCRQPLEDEKEGLPYPYTEYWYDDKERILFIKHLDGSLYPVSDKYGSKFNDTNNISFNKRYDLINGRILEPTPEADRWQAILQENSEDLLYLRYSEGEMRRLTFAEYVKKLSTCEFKDGVTNLSDTELKLFEEAVGYSVFEVLEMDDEECCNTYNKLVEVAGKDRKYKQLPEHINCGSCELIWDVPDWMADWG